MLIGNVVDDTYTGIIDVKVTLTFYQGRPAATPDRVLTLSHGADGETTLTTPRNANASSPRCTPPDPAADARSTGT
ncbi:hypothetical protein GCM10027072_25470 [Streptomyces bullii]